MDIIYGQQEVTDDQDWERGHMCMWSAREKCYRSTANFTYQWTRFSLSISRRNDWTKINDFLTQARLNLDPNEHAIFIYDGAPAHNNPAIPGPNSELKKLPPYSPFLNIVQQAISA